jgi:type I restriction enzyme, S subunit
MAVKPGYKQTEVGVIPEEWEVTSLGSCLSAKPAYGINAPAVPYSDKLPAYIRITDITEDGRFCTDKPVSVKSVDAGNYYLSEGDIVFARTGASVGKSYRYNLADGPLVFAGFLIRVRPDENKLIPAFAAAYVTTGTYWRWVRLMSMRSGQPGINGNEYSQLPIPKPRIDEQRAIAAALSDVDALLGALTGSSPRRATSNKPPYSSS